MTDRLWITDPKRTTCLAEVVEVRGNEFRVDKALFAPRSRACRHPQNHDKGTIWLDGEKRRLHSVRETGDVWYSLRGTIPSVGQQLQCQLDQTVRNEASRAHTAMHLFLAQTEVPMVANPEVKGGGHFRLTYAWPFDAATCLQGARSLVRADLPVERTHATRDAERFLSVQHFQPPDPIPGPDLLPLVKIGDHCVPCDGSHVNRTGRINGIRLVHAAQGKEGFVVTCQVS